MIFDNFELHASPHIHEARCSKCRQDLIEIPNGFISIAFYCKKCKAIYKLKLVKMRDSEVNKEYLEELNNQYRDVRDE